MKHAVWPERESGAAVLSAETWDDLAERRERMFGPGAAVAAGSVVLLSSAVMGQSPPPPPPPATLPEITFPITLASIVTAIVAACAAMLVLAIGPKVAFGLIKRLVGWLRRAV